MIHHELAWAAKDLVGNCESRANGEARVTGRRLYEHAVKGRAIEYFSVSQAIECHAASEAERFLAGLFSKRAPMRDENFFEGRLHACRNIMMAFFEWLISRARGAKALLEIL
jgi:hypothetical protein